MGADRYVKNGFLSHFLQKRLRIAIDKVHTDKSKHIFIRTNHLQRLFVAASTWSGNVLFVLDNFLIKFGVVSVG